MRNRSAHLSLGRRISLPVGAWLLIASWSSGQSSPQRTDPGNAAAELGVSAPPAQLIHEERFEVGDLEDPSVRDFDLGNYLARWQQQFDRSTLPFFMEASLRRGGATSARCLRIPLAGGDALIVGPWFDVEPLARLRLSASLAHGDMGEARLEVGLVLPSGDRLPPIRATGGSHDWARESIEMALPAETPRVRVEIRLLGDPSRGADERGLGIGIDDIEVEVLPRLILAWNGSLQRVEPRDEHPLAVRSIGLPAGEYALEFDVLDHRGQSVFRMPVTRYVDDDHPLDLRPRLRWTRSGVRRGLFTVALRVRAERGWEMRASREFALAGDPPFPPLRGMNRWGVILESTPTAPTWLSAIGDLRILLVLPAPPPEGDIATDTLPGWFRAIGEFRRAGLLRQRQGWSVDHLARMGELLPVVREWYWDGAPASAAEAAEKMAQRGPYLRVGVLLPPAGTATGPGHHLVSAPLDLAADLDDLRHFTGSFEEWSARVDVSPLPETERAAALARSLFLYATLPADTVYLDRPGEVLVRHPEIGGVLPARALLAWEFTTAFLSGARYRGEENWDPRAVLLVFQRGSEEFLVALGDPDASHDLLLSGSTDLRAYDEIGRRLELVPADSGHVKLTLGRGPRVVQGLDLRRLRTLRSLRLDGDPILRGGVDHTLEVVLTNHLREPVRVRLELAPPAGWGSERIAEERTIAPGEEARWPLRLVVPQWFGVESGQELSGTIAFSRADVEWRQSPISLPIPIDSELVRISTEGDAAETPRIERVLVENIHDRPLRLRTTLVAQPSGREREFPAMTLSPGEVAELPADILRGDGTRRLLVGVVIETYGSRVERAFAVGGGGSEEVHDAEGGRPVSDSPR